MTRGRGRAGSPPRGDVRPVSRHVALETAFPSLWVSGGRLLPFSFFLLGGGGGAGPAPPLAVPATPLSLGLSLAFRASHSCVVWAAAPPSAAPCLRHASLPSSPPAGVCAAPYAGLCSRIPRQGRDPPNPGLYARQRPEGWIPGSRTSAPCPVVCRHSPVIQRVPQSAPSFRIPHPALWRSPGSQR